MAQADYVVANGTGAAVRSDLNGQLAAIVSNNSGVTEPATMYAYQWWADTTTGLLKIRNAANNAWITLRELDGTLLMDDGTAASPGLSFASDLDTGLFSAGTNAIGVATNGVERVEFGTSEVVFNDGGANYDFRIEGDTNTNLFFVDASADTVEINGDVTITDKIIHSGDTNTAIRFPAADTVSIETDGSERARIDSSGRLLVGTTSAQGTNAFQIEQSSGGFISLRRAEAATAITDGEDLGAIEFQDNAGGVYAFILGEADGTAGASDYPGRLVLATTADGSSAPTERMRITNDGWIKAGTISNAIATHVIQHPNQINGNQNLELTNNARFYSGSGSYGNAAETCLNLAQSGTTSRSINAGGSINASGADYAEYMAKAGDFTIAKGDICGVTADGKLINVFADAVGFLVKSTNPSYVGGDTWGNEDTIGPKPAAEDADALAQWEASLEAARQLVDRIAFAGQVPVNVTGATPGQYIVPVVANDGGITGIAKDEADLTLAEYMRAVGKVIAIEDDGRARIIVKVA